MIRNQIVLALLLGLACAESAEAQIPVSDSDFVRIEPPVKLVEVNDQGARFNVAVMIDNTTELGAVTLPLTYGGLPGLGIDTTVQTPPDIIGITYGPAGRSPVWTIKTSFIQGNLDKILLGFIAFFQPFPPTDDTLCYIHFDVAPGTNGTVLLDSTIANNQHLGLTNYIGTPFDFTPTWTPGVFEIGIISSAGDMDCDGEVTVGDIIYLVNFIFKAGPEPCELELADTDCDGQLAVSDAIYLVNYLFRGGPEPGPPCD